MNECMNECFCFRGQFVGVSNKETMARRTVSHVDDSRLIGHSSLEKRASFMARFIISTPRQSFDGLLKHLDSRNEVETVLRLSDRGISWGKHGGGLSWWRPWNRTLPFARVDLSAVHDIFQESSQPQVLICVVSPAQGARDSNYQAFAFRLHDVDDVRGFQGLFQLLTNAGGTSEEATGRLDNGESSPSARLAVRPSQEVENRVDRGSGDRIPHGSTKTTRNSTAVFDPNNNSTEDADSRAGNHVMTRSFSHPTTTPNRLEYYSPQPIRRQNGALETIDIAEHHQVTPETVPIYAVVVKKTEDGRPVPATRSKVTSKSLSDDEEAKGTSLDLTWTRNTLFSDKIPSNPDGGLSNYAAEGGERPKPMPRARNRVQESTVSPTEEKSYPIPERTVTPTQVKSYVIPERTVIPTQMKSRLDSSDNTSERTITPTQMRDQIQLKRAITPTGATGQLSQGVAMASVEDSPGLVRVYVPEYQSPVVPHRSLLKARKDPDSDLETATVDPGRQRKSLSFNPSVIVNGTTGNALSETESPYQPDMDVTDSRIRRHRHASWSDSSTSDGPENLSTVRNRVTMRGLSLPNGVPASVVAPSAVRMGSTADQAATDSKPHAWINGRHGSFANHSRTPLEQHDQVSEKFRTVQIAPSASIPVDVITEDEDKQYDRRPLPKQSTTHAVTDQQKGNKKGNSTGVAAGSKGQRKMGYFGRRSGEPALQYASDSEASRRSRSTSHIILGQDARRGTQVVYQKMNPIVFGGGGYPSMVGEATVIPNGRLEVRVDRARKEEEKGSAVPQGGVGRGKETGREDVRRGRETPVRESRRREIEDDEIRHVPATHDRHSDPVGRQLHSRRSQSVFDPRRVPPVMYNLDTAPSNGYLPGQLVMRSRSANRPVLLSRTVSHEEWKAPVYVSAGQYSGGGYQSNGGRKISRYHPSELATMQLHNGGVSGRNKRQSNYF